MPTIKEEMAALDRRDFSWYNGLTQKERDSLSMFVLMRYASATSSTVTEINEHYLTMINELVNVNFNVFAKHPEMQWRLMQAVGVGTSQFHNWIPPVRKKKDKSKNPRLFALYEKKYPHFSDDEIEMLIGSHTPEELREVLIEHGISDKEIKALLK